MRPSAIIQSHILHRTPIKDVAKARAKAAKVLAPMLHQKAIQDAGEMARTGQYALTLILVSAPKPLLVLHAPRGDTFASRLDVSKPILTKKDMLMKPTRSD